MKEIVVKAENVWKKYKNTDAVKGVSFSIYKGECVGFLGPNGAGKTTIIRMIYGFTPITSGDINVFGLNVKTHATRIKYKLGIVPQDINLDNDLTVLENLLIYAKYFDMPKNVARKKCEELLQFLELFHKKNVRIQEISSGMKRRLLISRALINDPELLILDEPTVGLDPQARHIIWSKLRALKLQEKTIIITTHYMEEAEELCDRVFIINEGKIYAEGNPIELVKYYLGTDCYEIWVKDYAVKEKIENAFSNYEFFDGILKIFSSDSSKILSLINTIPHTKFIHRNTTLEDLFLKLTGKKLK
jgi:lipooligosaccharide transport system ATP-binding protein